VKLFVFLKKEGKKCERNQNCDVVEKGIIVNLGCFVKVPTKTLTGQVCGTDTNAKRVSIQIFDTDNSIDYPKKKIIDI
jgi:hypothetical protein